MDSFYSVNDLGRKNQSILTKFWFFEMNKGAFKYYVIKEVGGWVGQLMMFDDKVGGWEWLNDDVIKK